MRLQGAQVLVTGGAGAIGRHCVARLLEDGATVAVLDKDVDALNALRELGVVKTAACDLGDAEAVDAALQALLDGGFEPDVLINNAGLIHSEPLVNMLAKGDRVHSRDNWRRVMAANLDSVFLLTSRVVDHWLRRRRKGVTISISSIAAAGNPGQTAYAAAKAGVNAMTISWAKELGPLGLRFAAIAPGFIDTPSTHAALSEATLGKLKQQIPLRRLGEPEAVYRAMRHVIENDYLTGTVLSVDGGLVI